MDRINAVLFQNKTVLVLFFLLKKDTPALCLLLDILCGGQFTILAGYLKTKRNIFFRLDPKIIPFFSIVTTHVPFSLKYWVTLQREKSSKT